MQLNLFLICPGRVNNTHLQTDTLNCSGFLLAPYFAP